MSVEQGYDPRDFSLVAFGGAGPLHANALGKLIGSFPVIIPPSPGTLCAFGDATTVLRHEVGKTYICVLEHIDHHAILDAYDGLLDELKKIMQDEQGVPEERQVGLCFQCSHYLAYKMWITDLLLPASHLSGRFKIQRTSYQCSRECKAGRFAS